MDRSDFERMAEQRVAPRNKQLIDHFSGDLWGDWSPNRRTFAERLGGWLGKWATENGLRLQRRGQQVNVCDASHRYRWIERHCEQHCPGQKFQQC